MAQTKSKQIAYWCFTLLILLPTCGSGVPEALSHGPTSTVQALHTHGFPLHVIKIVDLAKILGAITFLMGRPARFVEWASAGLTFLCLGATASHLLARDARHAPIPFVFFSLLVASYALHT